MNETAQRNISLINPNWSAFVLLVTILSVFNSVAIYFLPISDDAARVLQMANVAITVVLWADFFYLLRRSPNKRFFMMNQHGWMVLLSSFPFMRSLRIIWLYLILRSDGRSLRDFLSRIVIRRNAGGTLLFILFAVIFFFEFAVVAILSFEDLAPDGNITSVSDALWWAFTTVTTVGYGDKFPVTNGGRVVAVLLMAVGIALFSVITGSLAEWFSGQQSIRPHSRRASQEASSMELIAEVRQALEQQEELYQQSIADLKERLMELEGRL